MKTSNSWMFAKPFFLLWLIAGCWTPSLICYSTQAHLLFLKHWELHWAFYLTWEKGLVRQKLYTCPCAVLVVVLLEETLIWNENIENVSSVLSVMMPISNSWLGVLSLSFLSVGCCFVFCLILTFHINVHLYYNFTRNYDLKSSSGLHVCTFSFSGVFSCVV